MYVVNFCTVCVYYLFVTVFLHDFIFIPYIWSVGPKFIRISKHIVVIQVITTIHNKYKLICLSYIFLSLDYFYNKEIINLLLETIIINIFNCNKK